MLAFESISYSGQYVNYFKKFHSLLFLYLRAIVLSSYPAFIKDSERIFGVQRSNSKVIRGKQTLQVGKWAVRGAQHPAVKGTYYYYPIPLLRATVDFFSTSLSLKPALTDCDLQASLVCCLFSYGPRPKKGLYIFKCFKKHQIQNNIFVTCKKYVYEM